MDLSPADLPVPQHQSLPLLRLLHLADSALPVGGMAHSFGLESLIEYGFLRPENLEAFLRDWLAEAGLMEGAFCGRSCVLARTGHSCIQEWLDLNARLSARKPARELREASSAMARRLVDLAVRAFDREPLVTLAAGAGQDLHYACCFGWIAGLIGVPGSMTVAAFLHQAVAGLISACQRLIPLGHTHAHAILFRLKPEILHVAERAARSDLAAFSFTPLPETASMAHCRLPTRLFIS